MENEVNDPNFQKTDYSDNVAKISNLGVRLAAAFIAVHAKDYDALKKAAGVAVEFTKSFSEAGTIKYYADQAEQQAKWGRLGGGKDEPLIKLLTWWVRN